LLLGLLLFPAVVWAQPYDEVPSATDVTAITGARIVTAPGEVIESGAVVLRDGLIETVGADVEAPYDAEIIEGGDSLTVYAGFIDGLSHAGIPEADDEDHGDVENPGDPPPKRAGIQPNRHAQALMEPGHESIARLRNVGFTAAHVVPRGEMLPGTGALVTLGEAPDDNEDPGALVVRPDVSLYAQLEGAPGGYPNVVYPSNKMAVLAKMRQLYREAERRQRLERAYEREPTGRQRPPHDAVHSALFPVVSGDQPLAFRTTHPLDIFRVLDLQETLGFPLMLAGLEGAHLALDALRETDAPLFLTLALPDAPDDSVASDSLAAAIDSAKVISPAKPGSFFKRETRTISHEDTDAERAELLRRRAIERDRYVNAADTLRALGKRFGFSTLAAEPKKIRGNLRAMIERGLSEKDALAALTTDAARHLGVAASMGTVEPGKMGNLVVTAGGSYFGDDSRVRYVFVEGQPFEIEELSSEDEVARAKPGGAWTIEADALGGTLVLKGAPGDLRGTLHLADGETASLENVTLDDDALSFAAEVDEYAGEVAFDLTIRGDEMEGTAELPDGKTVPVTGSRVPP
jgi:hypothetical protein